MKVTVNHRAIELFKGARVKEAVQKFALEHGNEMPRGPYVVTDGDGNIQKITGRLSEDDVLFIKPKNT